MDAPTNLAIVAIVVSIVSLCASGALAYGQLRLSRRANHAPALMALYSELRSPSFHAHYNYVVHQLAADYTPDHGVFGLPEHAQTAVVDVAYYYQGLANMMKFGLLDKREVLPMIRTRIINLWCAIEPYVRVERQRQAIAGPISLLQVLEQHAADARKLRPQKPE